MKAKRIVPEKQEETEECATKPKEKGDNPKNLNIGAANETMGGGGRRDRGGLLGLLVF
jgi:hypothetical protein